LLVENPSQSHIRGYLAQLRLLHNLPESTVIIGVVESVDMILITKISCYGLIFL
jgi:hypothetical protein